MISLSKLRDRLAVDAYWGVSTSLVENVISEIYVSKKNDKKFEEFHCHFLLWPCSGDTYRFLIYLWIGLGLPAYLNGQRVDWHYERENSLEYWQHDFVFKKDELRNFLKDNQYPLPVYFFPGEQGCKKLTRNEKLQRDANALAKKQISESGKAIKRRIADELVKSDKWKHMTAERIERIISVQW